MKRLGLVFSLLLAALPATAAVTPGSISGIVRSSDGSPQMGVSVELLASGSIHPALVYTDAAGRFLVSGITPGTYHVKASAASFLPTLRENVLVKAGSNVVVNLTLTTLFEAVQLLPARKSGKQDDDDWKWSLRSAANRPILRVVDGSPVIVSRSERPDDKTLRATVAFVAGSEGEGFGGSPEYGTSFDLDQNVFTADKLNFRGRVGYGNGEPVGVVRAAYAHQFANSNPQLAVTLRRLVPMGSQQLNTLSSMAWTYTDSTTIGDALELNYGTEMQSVQFMGHLGGVRPFGSAALHLSPTSKLTYSFTTIEPADAFGRMFDSDSEPAVARITVISGNPGLERAAHHEVAYQRKVAGLSLQAAAFMDRINNLALTGAGAVSDSETNVLPDFTSDTFTFNGGRFATKGVRLVAERKVGGITATVDYGFGGIVTAGADMQSDLQQVRGSLRTSNAHSVATRLSGRVPVTGTRWTASYKWTSADGLTPVDLFNASPGQTEPYLSFSLRQPIPATGFMPGKMEAVVDVRNLLAEGYRPFVGADGHTLYLVQATRAVRGGLAFTF